MSSPSRYRTNSPVRTLEERFYSRPLDIIAEENNAYRLSSSLIQQNKLLERENQRLIGEVARSKDGETFNYTENLKLRRQNQQLEHSLRTLELASVAKDEAKQQQIENQERDIRLLRDQYSRQNQTLRDHIASLTNKISLIETNKAQEISDLQKRFLNTTAGETEFLKKNLGEELRKVLGQLQLTKHLLSEKQRQYQHLVIVSQQTSAEYTRNLQNMISENNILRNQLLTLELEKNKEIQHAQNKKQLQKSRTIGILSFCKENNHFMEKQLTRLAEELLQKNISIETFTKELLKQRKQVQNAERKFEDTVSKLKADFEEQLREQEKAMEKLERDHREDITEMKKRQIDLEEQLATRLNELQSVGRQLDHTKDQMAMKDRQIEELKESISRMHEDHSKELSKVMLDSRVKRRSGLNISSYSSSSLKDIEEAQGSSIIKVQSLDRKNSSNQVLTPSGLPVVKEELAVSQGHIDDEQEDIEIKELILHYESMIEELKKNKADQLQIASRKIEALKLNLQQKQQELLDMLNRFSPLMELKVNRASIEEERRAKIEQTQKADIAILDVMLEKYGIVSLRTKNR